MLHRAAKKLGGQHMMEIKTEINIGASVKDVWKVFTDLNGHAEWNPFLTEINGSLNVGKAVDITVKLEGRKPEIAKVILKELKHEKEAVFLMNKWPLIKGRHYFRLESTSDNETKFIHGEVFTGLIPFFAGAKLYPLFHSAFESMNLALKNRIE
ncbi:putative uncharacterized protein [Moritella viscosa]|nr:putative uncharacterized protein [Moritella viscosa]